MMQIQSVNFSLEFYSSPGKTDNMLKRNGPQTPWNRAKHLLLPKKISFRKLCYIVNLISTLKYTI